MKIPRFWYLIEWPHNEYSSAEANMFLQRKRIALIQVVIFASDQVKLLLVMQFAQHVLINTQVKLNIPADVRWKESFCFKDQQNANDTSSTTSKMAILETIYLHYIAFFWEYLIWKIKCRILVAFCLKDRNPFIQYWAVCLMVFFFLICRAMTPTGSCSALTGQSKPNCRLHCRQVWHLHSVLLSVCWRKSGLMSLPGSLTKQLQMWTWFLLRWSSVVFVRGETETEDKNTSAAHTSKVIKPFRSKGLITCK